MTAGPILIPFVDGAAVSRQALGVSDGTSTNGVANAAPGHAVLNSAGVLVDPADHATLASILAALQAALPLPTGAATASAQATATTALAAILAALEATLAVSAAALPLPAGASTSALQGTGNTTLASILAALQATQAVSLASVPLPTGAATQTTLAAVLATLQTQRSETLWTDDSGAYYVRLDNGGSLSWTDLAGNTLSAPGTGARPAAGTSAVIDRTPYQATAAATGYSIGDLIDHVVITDPSTGNVMSFFWLNTTTGLKLASAPSSANITPMAPLPTGAATAAAQATIITALASLLTGLGSVGLAPHSAVLQAGSTGTDYSSSEPAASGTLLATIPATTTRAYVEVQNQSAGQLEVLRDDGAGNNLTMILLAPAGANAPGGDWVSSTFKGRIRIYGASGAQFAAYQD
jgi:hypothetical protein